ncbi:mediator of DNA damage checkpoint protein 1-like isoform X2 [Triticum dicoccoides]|uniref:mediator of DNA damage checkpoint protein 1-like isoform X2 n=1 Tax=Triticum dicoccoides TaxID=85692 RepID=UPI00188FED0B|nr:mediator of DNA damage checkpoint protein 1-like isoform X2 [Triticum dicoccoides]
MDGGETQVVDDGGTPPLGSPVSSGATTQSGGEEDDNGLRLGSPVSSGDTTQSGGGEDDNDVLYGETQPLDEDDETEPVDDEFEGEGEERMSDDTQVVEDSEDDAGGVARQTQAVEEEEDGGSTEDEAGDGDKTQLIEECEVEDGGSGETQMVEECQEEDRVNDSSDDEAAVERGTTQLIEECQEEERVNDSSDDEAADQRGMTQLVEDSDKEMGDDGDDELSQGTQVQSDDEGVPYVKDYAEDSVDSDASTEEEGGTVKSLKQGKRHASTNGTFLRTEISHEKDGSKSKGRCSTAKKLFADPTSEQNEIKGRCFAGLSYLGSQEPGELSQANALDFVEGLISINGGISSQEQTPKKLEKAKPPVSIKMGTLLLAEKVDRLRSSSGKAEVFAWVDSREDDGGGDFFRKNKDILLHQSAGRGKSKIPRPKKCSTKIIPPDNKIIEGCKKRTKSKLCGNNETLPSSDSRLLKSEVKSKRASGKRSKKNLLKDLDDHLSTAKPIERQQVKASVDFHDVGQDTQMAVEAIEALAQSSPAENLSAEVEPPVKRDLRVRSKVENGNPKSGPPRKRTSSVREGVTTRSKRIKVTEMNHKPQKGQEGIETRQNLEEHATKTKHKQAKAVPQKNKVTKIVDGNKYDSTPIAHRTRNTGRNNLYESPELCSNKNLKKATVGEVRNNHSEHGLERPVLNERTAEYDSDSVLKENTKNTCANNAQGLQQSTDASIQHTSANVAQNLEPLRDEPTTHVFRREPSSHPKQRRTPTAVVQAKAPAVTEAATGHDVQPEVTRPSKKRRIFISSSELLTYARRERSDCRSTSLLSSIITQSSAASPVLDSSSGVNSKTSRFSSSDRRQKKPSGVKDASNSPKCNSPVPNSALKTPSKAVNKLSPTFSPLNPSKASKRSLLKPSVAKELLELDPENALPSRYRKDSRRKDMTSCSIIFSHHLDEDVIKRQKKILARLGAHEAPSVEDATHFVADGFYRTKNMLEAVTRGKLVVTSMWLESCGAAGCFVNDKKYVLRDAKKEKEMGFSMPISLASACKSPLLLGKRVFVTQNVKPSREVVTSLVSASSGQPLERMGRSIRKEKEAPDDLLAISCEEDYETCAPLVEKGVDVFDAELLLNGIVTQKLDYERHRLFLDRVKQTRSTRWLKDGAHGRFVPVSKS